LRSLTVCVCALGAWQWQRRVDLDTVGGVRAPPKPITAAAVCMTVRRRASRARLIPEVVLDNLVGKAYEVERLVRAHNVFIVAPEVVPEPVSCLLPTAATILIFFFGLILLGGQGRSGTTQQHASVTRPGWRSAEIYARSAKTRERRSAVAGMREWTLEWGEGAELDAH
jgi:hypothetical protein